MRMGEIMGLTWENINFDENTININQSAVTLNEGVIVKDPKTYSSNRKIEIPEYVRNTLEKYRQESGFVYTRQESESVAESGKNFGKRFQTILRQNNLPHTRFHDLRHFNATMMLKHGISDKEASEILGHTSINMTKKYQHIVKSMEGRVAKTMNTIVKKNSNGNQNGNQNEK